jgi:hypothetical protein
VEALQLAFGSPSTLLDVLQYPSTARLFAALDPSTQQRVSAEIVLPRVVNNPAIALNAVPIVECLFKFLSDQALEDADLVAKLLFRFENQEDAEVRFAVIFHVYIYFF